MWPHARALTLIVGVPLIFLTLSAIYNESTYLNKLIVDLRNNQGEANNTDSFVVSQESVPRHNLRLDVNIDVGVDKQKYKKDGDGKVVQVVEEVPPNNICHDIKSLQDTTTWPDIIFFEDHPNFAKSANLDPNREENMMARATVAEFNRIRNSVLRPTLLDAGIKEGSLYAAQSFAQRFLERKHDSRPLSAVVAGNSFTIGSNCGENTMQGSDECAWPNRLAQRWSEIVTKSFGNNVNELMFANGTWLTEEFPDFRYAGLQLYWANYTPQVAKTKSAYYPTNHPPWTTHQYVADSVLYTLLSLLNSGMGCDGAGSTIQRARRPPLPETTVADKAEIERCFVCLKPTDQLDARTHKVVVNATETNSNHESPVVVTCGDWKWVTDERKRSGWQSDQAGSLIRFRLKVSEIPTISLTYMKSHATFGSFRVTFQPISKANDTTPLMGCSDVTKFTNQTLFPSMRLEGKRQQFSLWDTFIFSGKLDSNEGMANEVMKKTVLEKMESKDVEYIDMYVLNDNYFGNVKRVKIQTVTSC